MKKLQKFIFIQIIILSFLPLVLFGAANSKNTHPRPAGLSRTSLLGVDANNHANRRLGVHDGNKILTRFTNHGSIADWANSPGRYDCGIYPIGSGRSYLAEFSPIVGAETGNAAGSLPLQILSEGMPSSSIDAPTTGDYLYQFEPRLGYANSNDSLIAMSDDTLSWPTSWIDLPTDWDGIWAGQYGKYSRADQESYFHMDDFNNDEFKYYEHRVDTLTHYAEIVPFSDPDSNNYALLTDAGTVFTGLVRDVNISSALDVRGGRRPDVINVEDDKWYEIDSLINDHQLRLRTLIGRANISDAGTPYTIYDGIRRGLGVDVAVRGYQWAHPAAEDILIFTYWIKNISDVDYEKFVFGMYGDADVGGPDGNQYDDDAWFDTQNDIVYQWDHNLWSTNYGGFVPAYFGWKYLESPGNPLDDLDNDEDGMIDESQDDGIDNDGDWDPYVDDVGRDGIGPNFGEYTGPDLDGTEGNGIPDAGEPNFEYTDNDESDQIGLTSFTAGPYPNIDLTRDGVTFGSMKPGSFMNISQTVDLTFMYGSAYFALPIEDERKFAVALIFGNDYEDILRNAATMQQIYNSDYNFAKPPNLPRLTAVAGDKQVTLYWDDKAELSVDPIYGLDFEGYRIYRATDPAFNEIWTITDTYGNQTFNKPVAQFDKADGLTGPHPYGLNGIHLDMGTDTGLRHSWTDTEVENGQTYYYAVVAYDYGFDYDFYDRGISVVDLRPPITPAECTKKIEINASGDAVHFDINTALVVPNAPAMAFVPPEIVADATTTLGTGSLEVTIIDPSSIKHNDIYEITFRDWSEDGIDNDGDWRTWTDDSTTIVLNPTLNLLIPPNSDTLHVNIPSGTVFQGITAATTRFSYTGYPFVTSFVDTQTVTVGGVTYLQYFIEIPETSFVLLPTLGVWDGWEPIYEDLGMDGCGDAYETGDPDAPCSATPLNLGGDPNADNWHPINNPGGTQANAKPDPGEPNFDSNDIDEITRLTSSYQLQNVTTGHVLLSDQTDLTGEARGLVTEGFKVNITNDDIVYDESRSGWLTSGLNLQIYVTQEKYNTVPFKAMPFDVMLTIDPQITDTTLNNKRVAFHVDDLTNQVPLDVIYTATSTDTLLRAGSVIYPVKVAGGESRVIWKMSARAKVGDINAIRNWGDLTIFGTADRGVGVFDGNSWSNITTDQGLITNSVLDLAMTQDGHLMVGSAEGLNVHSDLGWAGYKINLRIVDYNAEEANPVYLSFARVVETSDGILWSISNLGIFRWDWHRSRIGSLLAEDDITLIDFSADTFSVYSNDSLVTGVLQNESRDLVDLGDGRIAIGTKSEGLEMWDPQTESFWYINQDNTNDDLIKLPSDKILSLCAKGDSLYIGTETGLAIYNLLDSVVVYVNKDDLLDRKIVDVTVGADGRIHLTTKNGYNIVDLSAPEGEQIVALDKDDVKAFGTNKLQTVAELPDGTFWVGTENSVARFDGTDWEDWSPEPGDQFIIKSRKPFSALDVLSFTALGPEVDSEAPASLLKQIAVVPNPYVVTASWEPQLIYDSGRGVRKIDFINLPPDCSIQIFTISGKYVDTVEHHSEIWDGAESWNLLSRSGLEIAYGVYIFHVDAPGIGTHVGKFAVIK